MYRPSIVCIVRCNNSVSGSTSWEWMSWWISGVWVAKVWVPPATTTKGGHGATARKRSYGLWNFSVQCAFCSVRHGQFYTFRWARWIQFPVGMGLANISVDVGDRGFLRRTVWFLALSSFLGSKFQQSCVWRLILDPFCPLVPPVELPISVNDFRSLPASYGGSQHIRKRMRQRLVQTYTGVERTCQWHQPDGRITGQNGRRENDL